jgi:hypothetical protein
VLARARYQWVAFRKDPRTIEGLARVARIGTPWLDMPATQLRYSDLLLKAGPPTADAHASAHEGKGLALFALGRLAEAFSEIDSAAGLFDSPEARLQQAEWRVVSRAVGLPVTDVARWEARLAEMTGDSSIGARATWALDTFAGPLPPDPFASTLSHLRRADSLLASGDSARAQRELMWHEASDIEGWPVGLSRTAEVSAAFGTFARLRRGCGHLERVKELWSEADSAVRFLMQDASRKQGCPQ